MNKEDKSLRKYRTLGIPLLLLLTLIALAGVLITVILKYLL